MKFSPQKYILDVSLSTHCKLLLPHLCAEWEGTVWLHLRCQFRGLSLHVPCPQPHEHPGCLCQLCGERPRLLPPTNGPPLLHFHHSIPSVRPIYSITKLLSPLFLFTDILFRLCSCTLSFCFSHESLLNPSLPISQSVAGVSLGRFSPSSSLPGAATLPPNCLSQLSSWTHNNCS